MKLTVLLVTVLASLGLAASFAPLFSSIEKALGPVTPQILQTFAQPLDVQLARNSYVYRQGTELRLNGAEWTASGANVYWLGLDENVQPPPGQPFYAPFNAGGSRRK